MKKIICLVMISCFISSALGDFSFDDITNWVGTGSNQAAMVVHWSSPEVFNLAYSDGEDTPMPAPIQEVSMVWGYRFDGTASAETMMLAIAAADPQLYVYGGGQPGLGIAVLGIGYDLNSDGFGLSNGSITYGSSDFTNGFLGDQPYADSDFYLPTEADDLYWGGWYGPNWELWHESEGEGGFTTAPDRGDGEYWTGSGFVGTHGEWDFSEVGISSLTIEDGSWVGWSIAAGGLDYLDFENPGTIAWEAHKKAPMLPVPEPATMVLLGTGSLVLLRRKRP